MIFVIVIGAILKGVNNRKRDRLGEPRYPSLKYWAIVIAVWIGLNVINVVFNAGSVS